MRMTKVFSATVPTKPNSVVKAHQPYENKDASSIRVLIVTSCTGKKRFKPTNQLTIEDFKDDQKLSDGSKILSGFACPAGQMYTGLQHLRVIESTSILRSCLGEKAVDLKILSAGYGLISENELIVPYSVTFSSMKSDEASLWGNILKIHEPIPLIKSSESICG